MWFIGLHYKINLSVTLSDASASADVWIHPDKWWKSSLWAISDLKKCFLLYLIIRFSDSYSILFFSKLSAANLSYIYQFCSIGLWAHLGTNMEIVYKRNYNFQNKLKILWQKVTLIIMSNFAFCYNVFNSRLLQRRQTASTCGKGLR